MAYKTILVEVKMGILGRGTHAHTVSPARRWRHVTAARAHRARPHHSTRGPSGRREWSLSNEPCQ